MKDYEAFLYTPNGELLRSVINDMSVHFGPQQLTTIKVNLLVNVVKSEEEMQQKIKELQGLGGPIEFDEVINTDKKA